MSDINFRNVALASLSAVFAFANIAIAVPAHAAGIETAPTATVRFGDLDLTSASGIASLDRRLHNAARTVCGDVDLRDLSRRATVMTCRKQALIGAAPQMAAVIDQARNGTKFADVSAVKVAAN